MTSPLKRVNVTKKQEFLETLMRVGKYSIIMEHLALTANSPRVEVAGKKQAHQLKIVQY